MYQPHLVTSQSPLGEKQELFGWAIGKLLVYIYERGGKVRCGDFHRPDKRGHMPKSLHYIKLAADLNVFIDSNWLESYDDDPDFWDDLGWYWDQLHPLCTWGGDFGDYNHFSVTHEGRK